MVGRDMSTADELRPKIYKFYSKQLRLAKIQSLFEVTDYIWEIAYNTVRENLNGADINDPKILKETRLGVQKLAEDTNMWLYSQQKLVKRLVRLSNIQDPNLLPLVLGLNTVQAKSVIQKFRSSPMYAKQVATRYRQQRAGVITGTESTKWEAVAKQIAWRAAQRQGALHTAMRMMWVTREDATVCMRCQHMRGQHTPLDWLFLTPEGFYIASPPLHTNCRCKIKLVGDEN